MWPHHGKLEIPAGLFVSALRWPIVVGWAINNNDNRLSDHSQAIHSHEHPQGSECLHAQPFFIPPHGQLCSDFGEASYLKLECPAISVLNSAEIEFTAQLELPHQPLIIRVTRVLL